MDLVEIVYMIYWIMLHIKLLQVNLLIYLENLMMVKSQNKIEINL